MNQGLSVSGLALAHFGLGRDPRPEPLLHVARPLRQEEGRRGRCGRREPRTLGDADRPRPRHGRQRHRARELPPVPGQGRLERRRGVPHPLLLRPDPDGRPDDVGRVDHRPPRRRPRPRLDAGDVPRHVEASGYRNTSAPSASSCRSPSPSITSSSWPGAWGTHGSRPREGISATRTRKRWPRSSKASRASRRTRTSLRSSRPHLPGHLPRP